MKKILLFLRATLAGGLLFLVPFVAIAVIVEKALGLAGKVIKPIAAHLPAGGPFGLGMETMLSIGLILFVCILAGFAARLVLARRASQWLETTLLSNIPGYEFMKGMGESVLGAEPTAQWEAVVVRLDDCQKIGFIVERLGDGSVVVFLPDAPNPKSGEVCVVTGDRVAASGLNQGSVMKCLKRMGLGMGELRGKVVDGAHHPGT